MLHRNRGFKTKPFAQIFSLTRLTTKHDTKKARLFPHKRFRRMNTHTTLKYSFSVLWTKTLNCLRQEMKPKSEKRASH